MNNICLILLWLSLILNVLLLVKIYYTNDLIKAKLEYLSNFNYKNKLPELTSIFNILNYTLTTKFLDNEIFFNYKQQINLNCESLINKMEKGN